MVLPVVWSSGGIAWESVFVHMDAVLVAKQFEFGYGVPDFSGHSGRWNGNIVVCEMVAKKKEAGERMRKNNDNCRIRTCEGRAQKISSLSP